jgi:ketosteroid isomerase-like protein
MPGENAAIVRRVNDALNRARAEGKEIEEGMADVVELLDPGIEFVNPPEAIDPGVRHGIDGWITAFKNLREGLGLNRVDIERLEEAGDMVATAIVLHGKAPGSGIEMPFAPRGGLWTVRDGRLTRFEWFVEPDDAFARLEQAG